MSRLRSLLVFGTRPEAIKMAPVVRECQRRADEVETVVCLTGQHREMLQQVTDYFQIQADFNLDLMRPNQTLPQITSRILSGFDEVLAKFSPDRVIVQGDTTTAMAAALSSYYRKIPVDHVEAGLRSGDIYSPFPEEVNRKVVGSLASLHFAPTARAAESLIRENVPVDRVFVTGNTVIDALLETKVDDSRAIEHAAVEVVLEAVAFIGKVGRQRRRLQQPPTQARRCAPFR